MSPYLYSFMGRSYLKPLNTRFIYLATTTTDIVVQVIYGNINLII